jgi:radical SAM superfamily enzyme YgiQ (UPF0313 family)
VYQPQVIDDLAHPLGIMALDAFLRARGYEDIHLHDMRLDREDPARAAARVLALAPDVVGLSSLTVEKEATHQLAGLIKERAPGVTVVIGGPYATSATRTAMRDQAIDYAVVGEGEFTFHELLEALQSGGDVADVRGVLYRRDGAVHATGARPFEPDLDALPIPSWDRVDMAAYQRVGCVDHLSGRPWVVFYTSRGCPFKCTYCHDVFGKKFRARSPAKVVEEMELLYTRYGVREFHFYDDIFNFSKPRVMEICRLITAKGWPDVSLQFPNGVRADMMDVEMLRALKGAGAIRLSYAIESASPRIQKSVKKHLKLDKVRQLIEDTDRLGLLAHGFFMLGFPGETREEVRATIDWALASKLHTAAFFLVSPFEGTPLSDAYVAPAREVHGAAWQYYHAPFSLSEVPAPDLKQMQREAYLRFYVDPIRMARLASRLPKPSVLLRFVPMFFKIIGKGFKVSGGDERSWDHAPSFIDRLVGARRPVRTEDAEAPEVAEPPREVVQLRPRQPRA